MRLLFIIYIVMKKKLLRYTIAALFLFSAVHCFSQSLDTTIYLHSEILGEERLIRIGLPKDYHESDGTYTSVYVLDADYKYDICRSIH